MESFKTWENLQFGQCIQKKRPKMMFTPEDDPKMWNFIAENFLNYGPFEVFTKMKESLGYEHVDKSLYYRFRNILAPNLHLTNFSVETKLKIAKKFNILLNEEFKQCLQQSMNLVFDSNGYVEDFSWKHEFFIAPTTTTSSEALLSLAALPIEKKKEKRSISSSEPTSELSYSSKKKRRKSTETIDRSVQQSTISPESVMSGISFIESLRDVISETVLASNRKLIEEFKASNNLLMKNEIAIRQPTNSTTSLNVKHYLLGLKAFMEHLNVSELEDIRARISSVEDKIKDDDSSIPMSCVHSILDMGVKIIGG